MGSVVAVVPDAQEAGRDAAFGECAGARARRGRAGGERAGARGGSRRSALPAFDMPPGATGRVAVPDELKLRVEARGKSATGAGGLLTGEGTDRGDKRRDVTVGAERDTAPDAVRLERAARSMSGARF